MLGTVSKVLEKLSIVLASQSPRRQAMLRENLNLKFDVVVSGFAENIDKQLCLNPQDYVSQTSRMKAEAVTSSLIENNRFVDFIISADTIVVCDNHILEKPDDKEGACKMLQMLSGRNHTVMTGVTIGYKNNLFLNNNNNNDNMELSITPSSSKLIEYNYYDFVETTQVKFAELDETIINAYVATGEPMDKAGSYGIQAMGATLVEGINGCYFNVVGFPLHRFCVEFIKIINKEKEKIQ